MVFALAWIVKRRQFFFFLVRRDRLLFFFSRLHLCPGPHVSMAIQLMYYSCTPAPINICIPFFFSANAGTKKKKGRGRSNCCTTTPLLSLSLSLQTGGERKRDVCGCWRISDSKSVAKGKKEGREEKKPFLAD